MRGHECGRTVAELRVTVGLAIWLVVIGRLRPSYNGMQDSNQAVGIQLDAVW